MCSQVQHSASITQMIVKPAPEPNDIIIENLMVSKSVKVTRTLLVLYSYFVLLILRVMVYYF